MLSLEKKCTTSFTLEEAIYRVLYRFNVCSKLKQQYVTFRDFFFKIVLKVCKLTL